MLYFLTTIKAHLSKLYNEAENQTYEHAAVSAVATNMVY